MGPSAHHEAWAKARSRQESKKRGGRLAGDRAPGHTWRGRTRNRYEIVSTVLAFRDASVLRSAQNDENPLPPEGG